VAYCSIDEVISMLKPDMLDAIIDGSYREDDSERKKDITPIAGQAIADAQAEIDGYLTARYNVPFARVPAVIGKFAKDIAIYNLVSRMGIDESDREKTYLTRYNVAVAFLTKASEGKVEVAITPEDDMTGSVTVQNNFETKSNARIFTRHSMRGW